VLTTVYARTFSHLQVLDGAQRMKAGWAQPYLPKGFWNMPAFTAGAREAEANSQGFPISAYTAAIEDMDATAVLRAAEAKDAEK
jgi:hypothetical protein